MYERGHHQRIARILQAFNSEFLRSAECYFGGGTAIVLQLDEYRESIDIDFLCASRDGYRAIRNAVTQQSLGELLTSPVDYLREVRSDRDKVFTILSVDGNPIKFEIVLEARIDFMPDGSEILGVPTLSRSDLYAEKLLANADRWMDRATWSRDIIDLGIMIARWGDIPDSAWGKVRQVYGEHADRAYLKAIERITDVEYLALCLDRMGMRAQLSGVILGALGRKPSQDPGLGLF